MTMLIPGSEIFSSRPADPEELRRSLPTGLVTHSVRSEEVDELDPLTYEVVRHRLWSVTDEMGEALKRMSGSPIVTDANDFDFAICDELGQEVQVGLYNTMLVGAVDLAIYWTLRHRAANPGIVEGDMFLCNDPWVGGGLHQNDVIVYQPVFHDGKLFAWTSAIAHQPDLGGVGLGSFSPAAQDVFSESLPTPPVKVVREGQLQRDVADLWVRRSRVPMLIGLDLRAKIGANNVGRDRLHALIAQYGADTGFREAGIQAITFRVRGTGVLPFSPALPEIPAASSPDPAAAQAGRRPVCLDAAMGFADTPVYDYRRLRAGHVLTGPAIVEVPTTTVVVPSGTTATVDTLGNLTIRPDPKTVTPVTARSTS